MIIALFGGLLAVIVLLMVLAQRNYEATIAALRRDRDRYRDELDALRLREALTQLELDLGPEDSW